MNEENKPASPIKLHEDINYKHLTSAHEIDQKDGDQDVAENESGTTENHIYTEKQAKEDNARAFREQAREANTPELVAKLKKSLRALQKSDLDANRDQIVDDRAKRAEKVYRDEKGEDEQIGTLDAVKLRDQHIASNEPLEVDEKGNATISEFDLRTGKDKDTREIIEVIIKKREEKFAKQDKKAANYIQFMGLFDNVEELESYKSLMETSKNENIIRDSHYIEILLVHAETLAVLQNEKAAELTKLFKEHKNIEDSRADMAIISNALTKKYLAEDQTPALTKIIKETLEINAIRNIKKAGSEKELEDYLKEVLAEYLGELGLEESHAMQTAQENRILELQEGLDS